MTFAYPLYLWAAGIVVLLFVASAMRTKQVVLPSLRFLLLLTLVVASAGPQSTERREESKATLLLDVSQSIDPAVGEMFLQRARTLIEQGIQLSVVPFAETVAPAPVSLPTGSYSSFRESWGKLRTGESNLDAALAAPAARGTVLLASDGFETRGSVERSIASIAGSGTSVFPIVDREVRTGDGEFSLHQLSVPLVAPLQKSAEIRASVKNTTTQPKSGRVKILHGGKVRIERDVRLAPGEEQVIIADSESALEGLNEVVGILTPDSGQDPTSELHAFLSSAPRERVLLLHGSPEDARFLDEVFQRQSYQMESVILGSGDSPDRDLATYSAVVLNNVSLSQIAPRTLQRFKSYVENGGGLIISGGNRSFGLGGYRSTVLDDLSPLESLPPQTVKKRLNVGIALVIDKSRSMATDQRLDGAKDAAREVIRTLKSDDYITVIGFDAAPFVVVKIGRLADIRETALDRVGRLFPAGKTNLLPAIDEGRRALSLIPAGRKHMVILTDGRIPDEGPYYLSLVKDLRTLGITVSTILLGGDSSPGMLQTMAEIGGGQYYQSSDPRNLPRLFIKDIKVSTGEDTMKEQEEYLVRMGTAPITSTSIRSFPTLKGYVQTRVKPKAKLELVTFANQASDPLLASWSVGKGTVVAFASDTSGRWSAPWIRWERYFTFWSDLVDTVRPKVAGKEANIKFDLRHEVARRGLNLDLSLFSEVPGTSVVGTLIGSEGKKTEISFSPTTRGRYAARVEPVIPGPHTLQLSVDGASLPKIGLYLPGDKFGEQMGKGFNFSLLEKLATQTGGIVNPTVEVLRTGSVFQEKSRDHTPLVLALAFLLLLLEISARERKS